MPTIQKNAKGQPIVTLIPGDGIGPECVESAKQIIDAAGVGIEWEVHHAGESVFKQGIQSGVPQETIDSIKKTRCVLKGPLGTPIGFGEKSANVTLRKLFETYANIRPVRELPGVTTPYSGRGIDLVVVRENVEDLYAGIEHMQTPSVAQCLKLISRKGCEKIVRMAFEFARSEGRKSVACATKSNIMKLTEGLLKRTFEEIAKEYPDIQSWHVIIDNACHQLVKKPEQFDVIVTTNMNGDIMSDLTSALIGGLGFAPSANLGSEVAIFEAVHGSAPKYAGKNVINPTAVISSSILMLRYLGEFEKAKMIENALIYTREEGKARTGDVVGYDSGKACKTTEYTQAIIGNFGKASAQFKARDVKPIKMPQTPPSLGLVTPKSRRVVGIDYFIETAEHPAKVGPAIEAALEGTPVKLKMMSNRGTQVYPDKGTLIDCVDQSRCRIVLRDMAGELTDDVIVSLLPQLAAKARWAHIEKLQEFDGQPTYTKAQGED
jgi:isocitrate dehydrogenase